MGEVDFTTSLRLINHLKIILRKQIKNSALGSVDIRHNLSILSLLACMALLTKSKKLHFELFLTANKLIFFEIGALFLQNTRLFSFKNSLKMLFLDFVNSAIVDYIGIGVFSSLSLAIYLSSYFPQMEQHCRRNKTITKSQNIFYKILLFQSNLQ